MERIEFVAPARLHRRRRHWQWFLGAIALCVVALDLPAAETHAPQALRDLAEQHVRDVLMREHPGVKIEVVAGPVDGRLRLPACPAAQAFIPQGQHSAARQTVGIRCTMPSWRIFVPVSVHTEVPVLVTRRGLPQGSRVAATDVALETRRVPGAASQYLLSLDALQGQLLRQALPAGTALHTALLVGEALVKRGQPVALVARVGSIEVRAAGEALADARPDGRVRVRNLDSSRILEGRVEAAGQVAVGM
ncbi:MAG: hypothetical protein RL026_2158 [Pseudomonadota bacterium]